MWNKDAAHVQRRWWPFEVVAVEPPAPIVLPLPNVRNITSSRSDPFPLESRRRTRCRLDVWGGLAANDLRPCKVEFISWFGSARRRRRVMDHIHLRSEHMWRANARTRKPHWLKPLPSRRDPGPVTIFSSGNGDWFVGAASAQVSSLIWGCGARKPNRWETLFVFPQPGCEWIHPGRPEACSVAQRVIRLFACSTYLFECGQKDLIFVFFSPQTFDLDRNLQSRPD